MNEKKKGAGVKLLLSVVCLLLIAVAVVAAVMLDRADMLPSIFEKPTRQLEATGSLEAPPEEQGPKETLTGEIMTMPDEDQSAQVTLPTQQDPETGEPVLSLPCRVPGYDLVLERIAPYSGMYVEDGSNQKVSDVAMLLVRNAGSYPVEYAELAVNYGDARLVFRVSALPAGKSAVVQEQSRKAMPEADPSACKALVVRRAQMGQATQQVSVTDNGDGTLTIRNLTDQPIPTVRIFYKYYMDDQSVFVGGIAFTVRITRLAANGETTIQPSHYTSSSSRIVMVSTYEE